MLNTVNRFIFITLAFSSIVVTTKIDVRNLKCLVCQTTIEELENVVSKLDPTKTMDVGGYRLDSKGNVHQKTISQSRSEIKLSEIMEDICEKLDDYVRATWKHNGQLTLLKLMTAGGQMNSDMSKVDIIQDGDLNKSLKFYCEGIIEEYEDNIIKYFRESSDNIDIRVCSLDAKYCDHSLPEEEEEERTYDEL